MFKLKIKEFEELQSKYAAFGAEHDSSDYLFQDRLLRMVNEKRLVLSENWNLDDILGSAIIAQAMNEKLQEIFHHYDASYDSFIRDYCWRIVS